MSKTGKNIGFVYCHCGCGNKTPISQTTDRNRGYRSGLPHLYCKGHRLSLLDNSEAFWSRVAKGAEDECWPWRGHINDSGYGDTRTKGGVNLRAHRIAYEFTHGPIPEGLFVLHRCDNRPCCNPSHLFLGTAATNSQDMIQKGRQARDNGAKGSSNHGAKLTESQVREIRNRYASGGILQQSIADEMGLSLHQINGIITRRSWRHLE